MTSSYSQAQSYQPPSLFEHETDVSLPVEAAVPGHHALSPGARWWQRFKRHRLGYWSLIIFASLYAMEVGKPLVSNDKPLLVYYQGHFYFPIVHDYPERIFGGNIPMFANYQDPFIRRQLSAPGNFVIYTLNHYSPNTVAYFASADHHPGAPSRDNWLGTDSVGYDITAQLLVGFQVSVTFAFALTIIETMVGIFFGSIQGYFAGTVDLVTQRIIEVWSALPELFLLLIFAAIFKVTFVLLFIIMAVFGWVHVSHYVRAEFLRNRQLEYVKSARALGLSSWQIMTRHILPNSITPVITLLPFRLSASIIALASLDFLGLGVNRTPSLGNLLLQGKQNLDAWWISVSAIGALVLTLLLLNFIGEALRGAMNTHDIDMRAGEEA